MERWLGFYAGAADTPNQIEGGRMTKRIWPFSHKEADVARYKEAGLWSDQTVVSKLDRWIAEKSKSVYLIDGKNEYTYAELADQAYRLASQFEAWGLQQGDVISFSLPNWFEAAVLDAAASIKGLVINPIIPIYREREFEFILRDSASKVVFIPREFRGFDYAAMIERIRSKLPHLERVITVRTGDADASFASLIERNKRYEGPKHLDADSPKLLMYTSGTTGRPKGVVHSQNTLNAEYLNTAEFWRITENDVCLMPSPVTHVTGYAHGMNCPLMHGYRAVLMDRWDAAEALQLIRKHKVSFSIAATPFLQELLREVEKSEGSLESLRFFICGGASVPAELIHRAFRLLPHTITCRAYGATEAPTVSMGTPTRNGEDQAANTDGQIVGHEVRIVDEAGAEVPDGQDGEITTRGPEMMLGYLDPQDNAQAWDKNGFFRTGDVGHKTTTNCLVITDRIKDLIIRGGENLSAKEIEDALYAHPDVREAAVVAMPHARLGEGICAYVVLKEGGSLDVVSADAFLTKLGLARQKHPEHIEVVDQLPKNAAGKIMKFVLRDEIRQKVGQGNSGTSPPTMPRTH